MAARRDNLCPFCPSPVDAGAQNAPNGVDGLEGAPACVGANAGAEPPTKEYRAKAIAILMSMSSTGRRSRPV
jgi:hypothetical protein